MSSDRNDFAPLPGPPAPSALAERDALAHALTQFDKKFGTPAQGDEPALRLTEQTALPPSRRSSIMPRARHLVAACCAILVAGSAVGVYLNGYSGQYRLAAGISPPSPGDNKLALAPPTEAASESKSDRRNDGSGVQPASVPPAHGVTPDQGSAVAPAPGPHAHGLAPPLPADPQPQPKGEHAVAARPAQPAAKADAPVAQAPATSAAANGKRLAARERVAQGGAGARSAADGRISDRTAQAPAMHVRPGLAMPTVIEPGLPPQEPTGRDRFNPATENAFKVVREAPVSTFSIDVDTASYSFMRASLARNVLPQPASVRVEEMINYFPYAYPAPSSADEPFRTTVAVYPSPWSEGRKIVRIGIKGYAVQTATRPRANLVFLIDTSGSMNAPNRLPLVKQSLSMLVGQLDANDRVAIVTYAGNAGTALEPTPASDKARILRTIEGLGAGGSTAGAEGIRQAYALAEQSFDAGGVNRVILATDGDFNVGITDRDELKGFIERQRSKGIFLSVLGFGIGNYNDALMQALAQNGNGVAAYIDTINEARKVLVEEATSTLFPIAKDVKIQVELNPATVAEYRLIGYETRLLNRDDFTNDKVDAGDVGSGQTVTALYEIVPAGGPRVIGDLRYGEQPRASMPAQSSNEYGFVRIRYKLPRSETSTEINTPIGRASESPRVEDAPVEARFATAVAAFGELLRGGRYLGTFSYDDVLRLANGARGDDPFGYRSEFVQLVRAAKTAGTQQPMRR
ncbi:MAG: von Willebrand factor type A domain-containing protein [Hyphomicrobiales bacterium]|nr:von Willebrand factor type A domain-containing protein [Hyphomicrobiales bacterium]